MGIEPTLAAWEAAVLPLNYTRAPGAGLYERGGSLGNPPPRACAGYPAQSGVDAFPGATRMPAPRTIQISFPRVFPFPLENPADAPPSGTERFGQKIPLIFRLLCFATPPQIAQKPEAKPGASVTLTKEAGARACGSEPNRVHVGKDLA